MKIFFKTKELHSLILSTITILFLISFPGAGLSGTLIQNQSITHDGIARNYHLYVPDDIPGSSVPILFILHGGTSNADQVIGLPGNAAPAKVFLELADIDKFIVVIPNGVAVADPTEDPESRNWNDCRGDYTGNGVADDVGFIEALIDKIKYDYSAVDLNRVYCKGHSNGGLMCLRLAHELSNKIAAIAATSAANATVNNCQLLENPISIMMINGTDDPIMPWDGGQIAANSGGRGTTDSVTDTVAFWASRNSTEEFNITDIPDIDSSDNSTVSKETYGNGEEGTEVILYRVNGGGHPEPSIQERYSRFYEIFLVGRQNHDIETAVETWAFLQKHGLNGPASCDESDEICDGIDNDCDGEVDEGFVFSTYYNDADGDTFGDPNNSTEACSQPEGHVTDSTDCDDDSSGIYPGATETCDGKDNDCDDHVDEYLTRTTSCGVGACSGNTGIDTCTAGSWGGDTCDPLAGAAAETCDGSDNDCDGQVDEGVNSTYYRDADGDTYGDPNNSTDACSKPDGYVANNTDCDDSNSGIYLGATETCDGVDNNCDGTIDEGCSLCQPIGATCSSDSECCTGKCRGKAGGKTCK